jgi:D-glycero-D-manno-heptose 1,7-bisphosphate phosphatase
MAGAAVFVDKDGTLVHDVPYNVDPDRMTLTPRAGAGLRAMRAFGYSLIVVSNQSGVARGFFSESDLAGVEMRLRALLARESVELTSFVYCPHHPGGVVDAYAIECPCRKPRPGLLERAAATHGIDLDSSWMIGDVLDDIEAGRRAGCRTILMDAGGETEWVLTPERRPDYVVSDLWAAAQTMAAANGGRLRDAGAGN